MNTPLISSLGFRRVATVSPIVSVADVKANVEQILSWCSKAADEGAEVIVLPELAITGYTLGDLVRVPDLLNSALDGLGKIQQWTSKNAAVVIVGFPLEVGSRLYNCAAVVHHGDVIGVIPKTYLPSTNEYYEQRWFVSGEDANTSIVSMNGADVPFGTDLLFEDINDHTFVMGVEICEDLWAVEPPSGAMARCGATLIVNTSASNEIVSKHEYRKQLVCSQSARTIAAYAYASSGPTESTMDTVFSGHCITAEVGTLLGETPRLQLGGTMNVCDVDLQRCITDRLHSNTFTQRSPKKDFRVISFNLAQSQKAEIRRPLRPHPFVPPSGPTMDERCHEIIALQATGLAVRMQHIGIKTMVLGLSGGLDSTLAAIVCKQTAEILNLQPDSIHAISMPGLGTSSKTQTNAEQLAIEFGFTFSEIPISEAVRKHFADIGHSEDNHNIVYENAQARERTQVLMDIANSVGGIVVGTGDMSELALGWCTFNADQMSNYSVNAGVPKTLVQHLVRWYATQVSSETGKDLLLDIASTPISPELLPTGADGSIAQHTEQVLGPFEVHDFFLYHFVRMQRSVRSITILACIAFDGKYSSAQIVAWFETFLSRFFSQQFKRSSMPDGVKIGTVALSPRADWRMPSDARATLWLDELYRIRGELGLS